jgi:hypothetical protein
MFAQDRRIQASLSIGQVQRLSAPPRLGIDHVARFNEPCHIGDGVAKQEIIAACLYAECLVEIGRGRRIQRNEGEIEPVDVRRRSPLGRELRGSQHVLRETRWNLKFSADRCQSGGKRVIGIDKCLHGTRLHAGTPWGK